MNRKDILRMAREAGMQGMLTDVVCTHEELERFFYAAYAAGASEAQWKQAVINELVCCHIYNESHDQDPRKAVHDAISWNVEVALDPRVSSQAQALIDLGASIEREACAKLAAEPQYWSLPNFTNQPSERTIGRIEGEKEMSRQIVAAIRARSKE